MVDNLSILGSISIEKLFVVNFKKKHTNSLIKLMTPLLIFSSFLSSRLQSFFTWNFRIFLLIYFSFYVSSSYKKCDFLFLYPNSVSSLSVLSVLFVLLFFCLSVCSSPFLSITVLWTVCSYYCNIFLKIINIYPKQLFEEKNISLCLYLRAILDRCRSNITFLVWKRYLT